MHGREQRVLLRHYLERGLSKAEIARELGISRRTVYHWIATGQLDSYNRPSTRRQHRAWSYRCDSTVLLCRRRA